MQLNKDVNPFQESLSFFMYLWQRIQNFSQTSRTIVPIHLRTTPTTQARPGEVLCNFSSPELDIKEGEHILILKNENPDRWLVRARDGREGFVPAIVIWIPPPNIDAVERALR